MRTPKNPTPVSDDELRQEYEKTALYRMGIPMERALERVSYLRGMLESGAALNNRSSTRSPPSNVEQKTRPARIDQDARKPHGLGEGIDRA